MPSRKRSLLFAIAGTGPAAVDRTATLFQRGLALVYLAAFVSLGVQITGLVGSDGLLPLRNDLAAAAAHHGLVRYWLFPTLFWADPSDFALQAACWAGATASCVLLIGRWTRPCLALLFVLYLSLFYAGQVFTAFQWDLLLLETGFLALVLCRHSRWLVVALRWLLLRFMLMSGIVKLQGDVSWLDFDVLHFYFETQPLPTPLAWPAAGLPPALLATGAVTTLAIELVLPFLLFAPRRARLAATAAIAAFQIVILATGNYGFFNLLVIVLCIAGLDDGALARLRPHRWLAPCPADEPARRAAAARTFVVFSIVAGFVQVAETWRAPPRPDACTRWLDMLSPLHVVNRYGPFKAIVKERDEIVIEVSSDGRNWRPVAFRYKPGGVDKAPRWNLPHQPRLDWQMWFSALQTEREHPWFAPLLLRLLEGAPDVLALLAPLPDAAAGPPRYARATLYAYRQAGPAERARGIWWVRRPVGLYYPAVQLERDADGNARLVPLEGIVGSRG